MSAAGDHWQDPGPGSYVPTGSGPGDGWRMPRSGDDKRPETEPTATGEADEWSEMGAGRCLVVGPLRTQPEHERAAVQPDDPEWWAAWRARREAIDRAREIIADADAVWYGFLRERLAATRTRGGIDG